MRRCLRAELLLDYCAGKLSPETAAEVESHLDVCSECRLVTVRQQQVWRSLDLWTPKPVSDDFDQKLYARIENEPAPRRWQPAWPPAWSFAAACVAIAIALVIYSPSTVSDGAKSGVEPEQVERTLEDLEMLNQLSDSGDQTV